MRPLPEKPTCASCSQFVPSAWIEGGWGICVHPASGPKPHREDEVRGLYTIAQTWCSDFEVRMSREYDLKGIE